MEASSPGRCLATHSATRSRIGFCAARGLRGRSGWVVILAELAFPLALLAPAKVLFGVLALFALFHVGIAVAMGLDTYVWAFLAAYPSVLVIGAALRAALGLAD